MLWAQAPNVENEAEFTEIIELSLDEIQEQTWQIQMATLKQESKTWALKNRFWLDDHVRDLHHLAGTYAGHKLDFAMIHDWENDSTHMGISLKIQDSPMQKEIILGNYRPRFATGLSLGAVGGRRHEKMLELAPLGSVDIYSPMGLAMKAKIWLLEAMAFASMQTRALKIDQNNQIQSFVKHKSEQRTLDKERLWGAALAFEHKTAAVGALVYEQKFEWERQSKPYQQKSLVSAMAFQVKIKEFDFDLELGQVKENTHAFAALHYQHAGFKQSFSLAIDPDRKELAYGNYAQILSRNPDTMELSYNALFPLAPRLKMQLVFAASQAQKHLGSSTSAHSRLIAAIRYSDALSSANFKFSRFDKEVLQNTMQNYQLSRPDHWRFELDLQQKVLPLLSLKLHCRYQLEDKKDLQNNGFYYKNSLCYTQPKMKLEAGYQARFQNKYGIYYLDESYEGWSLSTKDASEIYLSGKADIKPISLSIRMMQSLNEKKSQSYILGLDLIY